ncbi:MAG: tail fiber domain-containing protein, partial [Luminiphilus sp.]|nr:tail fiber domain-containing protein [Luminiphilus sp.]
IHWPEGEPQPGDTHREYGRTWVYIPMPEGSPEPGVWKSIGGSGGSGGGGGGGTVWWSEIQNKPDAFPPEDHLHIGTDILIDTNEDGDYSDAPDLETVLKEFRDKVDAMMEQMVFGGSFYASTGKFSKLSDRAKAVGFADGETIPESVTEDQDRLFFISIDAGTVHGDSYQDGDWMVAAGGEWIPINYGNISIVMWDEIGDIPDNLVYDDIAYKPELEGKALSRYIDFNGNGKWIASPTGGDGSGGGGEPGPHTHGFDEIKDGNGNDLNDVVSDLEDSIAALQGDLIWAGSYSALQSRMLVASSQGQMNGFEDGAPLPAADEDNKRYYVMVIDDGGIFQETPMSKGDWIISDGLAWVPLNYVAGGGDGEVPIFPGNVTGRVLTWDDQSDLWTENTSFLLSDDGSIDMQGGIEAKGNITIGTDDGVFIGDGSGLYNLPGMEDAEPPVTSVNDKTGEVVLNAADVGASPANHNHEGVYQPVGDYQPAGDYAPLNHNHNGVYQPVGDYLTSFTESDPTVPQHVKNISSTQVSNWNTAYGWGDHSAQNYAKKSDIPSVSYPVTSVNNKTGAVNLTASDVGAQVAGSYASSNHSHSNYAASNHTHTGYAPTNHTHAYVPTSGNTTISGTLTATDFVASSDENLKKNIATAPVGMVEQLRGVEFEWKDNGEMSSGVIAQEVQKVLPHLVHENEHGLSVSYMGIIGYLIEEVKDLRRTIEEMK